MRDIPAKENKHWRVIDIIRWGDDYLLSKGFENPRREMEWLLQALLNYKRIDIYLKFEEIIPIRKLAILREWIGRRIKREPLQYITGSTEFYGLTFAVDPSVLIPRPETERIVDIGLEALKHVENPTILDIGTGSGCLAIALAKNIKQSAVTAIDISSDAITLAKKNAANLNLTNITFDIVNILNSKPEGVFDLVVSNPPYVSIDELSELMPDVIDFEPENALSDKEDGLTFYRRFANIGKSLIKQGGWMLLEVGRGKHPIEVQDIFHQAGYSNTTLINDYNGDPRILKVNHTEKK